MLIIMLSIPCRRSFCENDFINAAWHGDYHSVVLLMRNGSPRCFDSDQQVIFIVSFYCLWLSSDSNPLIPHGDQDLDFEMKCNIFPENSNNSQLFFSLAQVRCFGCFVWRICLSGSLCLGPLLVKLLKFFMGFFSTSLLKCSLCWCRFPYHTFSFHSTLYEDARSETMSF